MLLNSFPAMAGPYTSWTEWIKPPELGPSWDLSRMPDTSSPSRN